MTLPTKGSASGNEIRDPRRFKISAVERGMVHLDEIREDGEVIGSPVVLPPGSVLIPDKKGPSWVVLRQIGKAVALNRSGARAGMAFTLKEVKKS